MFQTKNRDQFQAMTTQPVSRLIPSLAVPTVISMLVSSIYNMADTFFVSRLGTSASAAVGIVFSLMAIIQAVGFTLGMGAGSLISRKLGEKDNDAADCFGSSSFFAAFGFGLLLTIFGLIFLDGLVKLLGSTPTIMPYSRAYARWILLGAPVMCACFVMNNILRSEGHAAFSMVALTSGGVLNLLLDPLFIFTFGLGTAGAAIATVISQCVSFLIFLQFFLRRKGIVRIRISAVSRSFGTYFEILTTGFPSLCRQGLASIATILLNTGAAVYGDAAIAAMSITTRIIMLVASVMIGIGQGFTPVAGYNYGAGRYSRVKQSYSFTVKLGTIILTSCGIVLFIFAPQIIRVFRDDADVISIGTAALRFQACTLPLHALIVSTNMLMQSTGKRMQATFLACNRQGIYFIPLILVLPRFAGLAGVEATQAGADLLSAVTAVPYLIWFFRNLESDREPVTDTIQEN
jgi:putative MATE family efflux protein